MSTPRPDRRILDWPDDVAQVADVLGLNTFAIAGMSGAGAYLAACAFALPERVRAVGMMGVACPIGAPGVLEGLTLRRRLMYRALPLMPHAVPLLRALGPTRVSEPMTSDAPACDKAVLDCIAEPYAAFTREAFRQGPGGLAFELSLAAGPWGFALEKIRVPVHVWHGDLDRATPSAMGRYLARTIPDCRAQFVADAGHFLAYQRWPEILSALAPT